MMSKTKEWFMECYENESLPYWDDCDYWYEQWLLNQDQQSNNE